MVRVEIWGISLPGCWRLMGCESMLFISGLSVLAVVLSFIGVAGIRRWAIWKQMLDIPNVRSSHTRPTPRCGGLAIVAVVLGGLWFYAGRSPGVPWLARY